MTQELREYGRSANGTAPPNGGAVVEEIRLASKPLDNKDIPCAFWDALPEPGSEHPDLLAIEALKAESSPLERAETLKVRILRGTRGKKKSELESTSTAAPALCYFTTPAPFPSPEQPRTHARTKQTPLSRSKATTP
jgi:hypothetical protein